MSYRSLRGNVTVTWAWKLLGGELQGAQGEEMERGLFITLSTERDEAVVIEGIKVWKLLKRKKMHI